MSLVEHARTELKAAGLLDPEGHCYGDLVGNAVLELVEIFAKQGHSGMSAELCIEAFSKVAAYQPLAPLTGEDDEWCEVADGVFQNKRCSHVFRQADRFDGQAYDIDGRVFREPNGCCYTNHGSFVPIVFPYTPRTEYVDVEASDA